MESEARYTLVGAVLLALAAAAIGATVWLASTGSRDDYRFYTIYFQRQTLEGLQVGGDVTMRGIKVGRVEDYEIDTDNINRVEVTVRVERTTPVSENTTAIVQRNLVTGLARISLVTPGQPGPPLTEVKQNERYPVIAEGQSNLDQIAQSANRLAVSGVAALDNLNATLSPENRAALAATLANVRDLSAALAARVDRIDGTMASLVRTADDIGKAARAIAQTAETLRADANPAVAQLETTLRDVSRAVERLEREATTAARRVDDAADIGTLEVRATAQELRQSAEILARAVDRLRDPRTALLGPAQGQLGPGERLR
jgi:phospholipid/cholesterol/gamma-HCH transport system substrate-binding protein